MQTRPTFSARLSHPLVADRARLDKITDNMYAQIHRVIHGRGRDAVAERALSGGESVMRFRPGAAHQTMTAIGQLMAGACAGPFQVLRRDLGGDESLLITSSDPSAVVPQAAHGMALYYAVERRGDYLVWVTLVDQARKTGQENFVGTLASHAAQRTCAAVTC